MRATALLICLALTACSGDDGSGPLPQDGSGGMDAATMEDGGDAADPSEDAGSAPDAVQNLDAGGLEDSDPAPSDGSGDFTEWAERTRAARVRLYETQSLSSLRQLCRERRLAVSGLKHEVACRLVQHDEDVQAAASTPLLNALPRLSPRGPPLR